MTNIIFVAFKVSANMSVRWFASGNYVSNPVFLYNIVNENLDNSEMKDTW